MPCNLVNRKWQSILSYRVLDGFAQDVESTVDAGVMMSYTHIQPLVKARLRPS